MSEIAKHLGLEKDLCRFGFGIVASGRSIVTGGQSVAVPSSSHDITMEAP